MIKMEEIKQLPLEELDNPLKVRHIRKDVARLKTVIREYELELRHEKKPRT